MYFALCRCELFIPEARSLKAKRAVLNRVKERLRMRFRASVAEVAGQDLWQRTTLGIALVGVSPGGLTDGLAAMRRQIEDEVRCQVIGWETRVEPFTERPLGGRPVCDAADPLRDPAADPDWDTPQEGDELFGPLWQRRPPAGEE